MNKTEETITIHQADRKKLGNVDLIGKEDYLMLVFKGREKTAYCDKELYIMVDEENTPIIYNSRKIEREGLVETLNYIHSKYMDKKVGGLQGLTGLVEWNSPKDDLWFYYGENNANSIVQIYGLLFHNYSFVPIDENSLNVMTYEQVVKLSDEYNQATYIKPVKEIDKKRYWEMLEAMPPKRWRNDVFYMSEAQIGDIHAMLCKIGDKYFEANRDVTKTTNTDFKHECLMYIADQEEYETEKNAKNSD